jgi:MFS transporter, DHA2 family, multidrug resistance protein
VNTMSPAYQKTLAALTGAFSAAGASASGASAQARGMIYAMIQRQAAMLSFLDDFKMLGVVFFAIIPIFFLMKRPKMSGGSVPVH